MITLCVAAAAVVLAAALGETLRMETAGYRTGKYIDYIETDGLRPAILFIHGGAWVFGDRTACAELCEAFAGQYDTYACDYTLAAKGGRPCWEQTVRDIAEAVRWIRGRKGPRQVFLVGISAGGHLALYHAARHRDVHGVAAISAPTDLGGRFCESVERSVRLWAGSELEAASVRPTLSMPPVCIVHGDFDDVVPVGHADTFVQECLEAGVQFEYHRFHSGVHCMSDHKELTWRIVQDFLSALVL
mgnify:CR=1 FL=1